MARRLALVSVTAVLCACGPSTGDLLRTIDLKDHACYIEYIDSGGLVTLKVVRKAKWWFLGDQLGFRDHFASDPNDLRCEYINGKRALRVTAPPGSADSSTHIVTIPLPFSPQTPPQHWASQSPWDK